MASPVRLVLLVAISLAVALTLVIHILTSGAIHASGVIYQYVQRDGTVVYTEQWDQIPAAYREKVQSLDGDTLEPIAATAAAAQAVTQPTPLLRRASRQASPQESWGVIAQYLGPVIEQMQAMNLSLPSHTQLGIGLTLFAFIAATFSILRMADNRLAKVAIKAMLMLMIVGSVYAVFLSDLAQTLITKAGAPSQPTAPQGTASRAASTQSGSQSHDPLSSLTQSIRDAHETSVEKAKQAVNVMNAANRTLESAVAGLETESDNQAPQGRGSADIPPAAKPRSESHHQARESIVHRVRNATDQINQDDRGAEHTAAEIESQSAETR